MWSGVVGVMGVVDVVFLFSMFSSVSAFRSPIIHGLSYSVTVLIRDCHAGYVILWSSCLLGIYVPMMVMRSLVPRISNSAAIMRLSRCVLCLSSCSLSLSHIIDTPPAMKRLLTFFEPSVPMILNPSCSMYPLSSLIFCSLSLASDITMACMLCDFITLLIM